MLTQFVKLEDYRTDEGGVFCIGRMRGGVWSGREPFNIITPLFNLHRGWCVEIWANIVLNYHCMTVLTHNHFSPTNILSNTQCHSCGIYMYKIANCHSAQNNFALLYLTITSWHEHAFYNYWPFCEGNPTINDWLTPQRVIDAKL